MVDIVEIEEAARRLDGVSVRTPLLQNFELDQIAGGKVLLKPECLQVIGAFKIRGAYNRLSQLTKEEAAKGVVAWSSGNHAQGVAAAAAMLGIHADHIVMPEDAPKAKLENTRRLGGEVDHLRSLHGRPGSDCKRDCGRTRRRVGTVIRS